MFPVSGFSPTSAATVVLVAVLAMVVVEGGVSIISVVCVGIAVELFVFKLI